APRGWDSGNFPIRRSGGGVPRRARETGQPRVIIYGINPVLEALRAGRVKELRVGDRADDRLKQLLALAAERGVRVRRVPADALERDSRRGGQRGVHQGVVV